MARAEANVVIGNNSAELGCQVVQAILERGGRAVFRQTDVTKAEDVKALVACAVEQFGRLDVAFNNTGFDRKPVPLAEPTEEDVSILFDVNVKGVFLCMKYEIEQMLKNGGGVIVNNSTIFGLDAYANRFIYLATKRAVSGMVKGAAREFATKGIRVNAVAPGPIDEMTLSKGTGGNPYAYAGFVPMGRMGRPEEIAAAVVWLCSDAASFVTGHTLPVEGGVWAP
jgi:NAD(P)-dependent dehydrogenase (short-subunit alcohol dehydrogenase family)